GRPEQRQDLPIARGLRRATALHVSSIASAASREGRLVRLGYGAAMQIAGSTVLLTGASGGLGQGTARASPARGAPRSPTRRRTAALERLAAELEGSRVLPLDLSSPQEVERLAREAGDVDILIANAGIPAAGRLESFTPAEIDRTLAVNLGAPIMLAHSLLP